MHYDEINAIDILLIGIFIVLVTTFAIEIGAA